MTSDSHALQTENDGLDELPTQNNAIKESDIPISEMSFGSIDESQNYYDDYGRKNGFYIRTRTSSRKGHQKTEATLTSDTNFSPLTSDFSFLQESTKLEYPQLHIEAKYLNILQGGIGFPNVYGFHRKEDYKILLMILHGPTLKQLFNSCNKKFSLKTVLMLADQMIDRIEFIHSKFFLHRDIAPHNLVMGLNEHKHLVYVIDFEVYYPLR